MQGRMVRARLVGALRRVLAAGTVRGGKEGILMKYLVLPGSFLRKLAMIGACAAVCGWCQPAARAQRFGGHVGGGMRMSTPPLRPVMRPMARAPMVRPLT